jgi:hypothetical protein
VITVLCGAYRNAGDHLIGDRARKLLRAFVDPDIVTVDRKAITQEHYGIFNRSRAVLLCGGPAYQKGIYPQIYPLDRSRISTRIIPFGLGWKGSSKEAPEQFRFTPEAADFVKAIHSIIELSSARDPLTIRVLENLGLNNALMTGCPAWYDLDYFETPYAFTPDVRTLVFSMPAKVQRGLLDLMKWLSRRFPKARKIAAFHHGLIPAHTRKGWRLAADFIPAHMTALRLGWEIRGLNGSLEKLQKCYAAADLHVGYRVHAHLFCLSQRKASILVNEDSRGVGQALALGSTSLLAGDGIERIAEAIETHFDDRGSSVQRSVEIMRETFPVMRRFLASV